MHLVILIWFNLIISTFNHHFIIFSLTFWLCFQFLLFFYVWNKIHFVLNTFWFFWFCFLMLKNRSNTCYFIAYMFCSVDSLLSYSISLSFLSLQEHLVSLQWPPFDCSMVLRCLILLSTSNVMLCFCSELFFFVYQNNSFWNRIEMPFHSMNSIAWIALNLL